MEYSLFEYTEHTKRRTPPYCHTWENMVQYKYRLTQPLTRPLFLERFLRVRECEFSHYHKPNLKKGQKKRHPPKAANVSQTLYLCGFMLI